MLRICFAGLVLGCILMACNARNEQSQNPSVVGNTTSAAFPSALPSPAPSSTPNGTISATTTSAAMVGETSASGRVVPTLRILSPKDGETITLPAEIRYQITGLDGGEPLTVHIHAFVGDPLNSYQVEIPLENLSGVAYLPDDKAAFLPGHRALTFQLAYSDHTLAPNPEAQVTIHDLTIEGRR